MNVETSVLFKETEEEYNSKRSLNLTSHALADYRNCPLLYHKKKKGQIEEEDTSAFVIGRAAHKLILEGKDIYEDHYEVGGPVNPKTNKPFGPLTAAFKEWAARSGKPVLTEEQDDLVYKMKAGVQNNASARAILSAGNPELVCRKYYMERSCQARIDWFDEKTGITDLKTCNNLSWFENDALRYRYIHQLSFYRAVTYAATGEIYPCYIIAVEKQEPFRCGVWDLGQDVLGIAESENKEAILKLQMSEIKDTWKTGFEEIRILDHL